MSIEGLGIIAFCIGMVIVGGIYTKRAQSSSSEFFVSGRHNSLWLIVAGHVMGWVGAGTLVGVYGSAYKGGLGAGIWYPVGFSLSFFVFGPIMARRIKRLGDARDVYTIPEIIRRRFAPGAASVYVFIETVQSIAFIIGQYMAIALVLDLCMGLSYEWACVVSGVVVLLYVSLGGLTGSLMVTLIQLGICIVGLILSAGIGLRMTRGFSGLMASLPAGWNPNPFTGMTVPMIIAGFLPTFINSFIYSSIYTRTFSAKDEKTAVKACYLAGVTACAIVALTVLCVFVCVSCVPGLTRGDYALIELFRRTIPWGGALFAAAIVSACMSTASEALIGTAATITKDIVQGLFRIKMDDHSTVRLARLVMIAVTVACVVIAVYMTSLLDLMYFAANLTAAYAPTFLVSVFWNRVNTQGMAAGMAGGMLTAVIWGLVPSLNTIIPSLYAGILISLTLLVIVTLSFPPPTKEQIDFIRPFQTARWREEEK